MKVLRNVLLGLMAVIVLGACYTGSMVLGWLVALTAFGGIVLAAVLAVLVFITYLLHTLWNHIFSSKK